MERPTPMTCLLPLMHVSGLAEDTCLDNLLMVWDIVGSRPDIPLHALAMLKNGRKEFDFTPDSEGSVGPVSLYDELKKKGFPLAYVGDVVGTGSSRKSATNRCASLVLITIAVVVHRFLLSIFQSI
jgi:aconitase B